MLILFSKLLSETIKQEQFEKTEILSKTNTNQSSTNRLIHFINTSNKIYHVLFFSVVTSVHLNPRETINGLSLISMANIGSHLMSTLNSSHLPNGTGSYFVSGMKISHLMIFHVL